MKNYDSYFIHEGIKLNNELVNKLTHFLSTARPDELFHIDLYELADGLRFNRNEMLSAASIALHNGLFKLEWEYHCPFCGGVSKESLSLHDASSHDYCGNCKVEFNNQLDQNIEVFFSIHPGVKKIPNKYYDIYKKKIVLDLKQNKKHNWHRETTITGADIVQNSVYRELMGDEILLHDQSLEMLRTTILFTDIKGSTQMYTSLGDSKAFNNVRGHFRILFKLIEKYDGVPVKTIGDAVMGSFSNEQKALTAALEIQKNLIEYYADKSDDEKIEIKIGLHTGSTLLVTLNDRLDYFGTTVNMAARIQGIAKPNDVVCSEVVFENEENKKIIGQYTRKVTKTRNIFKGLNGEYDIYHINLK